MHHAVACAPANPARSLRQAIIGGAICRFRTFVRRTMRWLKHSVQIERYLIS
jgi:hypothetical protein